MIKGWFDDFIGIIFPRRCHCCDRKLNDGERWICSKCLESLPRTHYHRLKVNPLEDRIIGSERFERATGYFFYSRDSSLSTLIHDFKYRNFPSLASYMGEIVSKELFPTGFFSDVELIIPVPIHFTKKLKRGYNQSEIFAKGLAKGLDLPVAGNLRAVKAHSTQTGKSAEEREKNLAGVFQVKNSDMLKGKHILLVDDVCTTGSTLREALKTIHEATGSECRITVLTLAVTE